MPLWMLVIIVAVGLSLVIGAVHVFGGKRTGSLDRNLAIETWRRENPEDEIAELLVSDDRMIAIIALNDSSKLGLVRQMGAHHIARRLESGSVNSILETDDGLDLRLNETTLPRVTLVLGNEDDRIDVKDRLEKLTLDER